MFSPSSLNGVFAEQLERLRPLLELVELRSRVPQAAKYLLLTRQHPQAPLIQTTVQYSTVPSRQQILPPATANASANSRSGACTAAMLHRHEDAGSDRGYQAFRFTHTTSRHGFLAVIICVDRDAIRLISYSQ